MCSTILEMAKTQYSVVSPFSDLQGRWWPSEVAKWNLLHNRYQNQPMLGNIFQTSLTLIFVTDSTKINHTGYNIRTYVLSNF